MVLLYAVPMGLFAGTVSTRREILTRDTPLVITLSVATIGFYVLIFLISRFEFRAQLGFSAMAALAASAPAVPFIRRHKLSKHLEIRRVLQQFLKHSCQVGRHLRFLSFL